MLLNMSRRMGTPTICIGENKGADQLRSNCEADQRLCFRYTDSTMPLLSNHLRLYRPFRVRPGRKPKLLVFSHTCSYKCIRTISCACLSVFLLLTPMASCSRTATVQLQTVQAGHEKYLTILKWPNIQK